MTTTTDPRVALMSRLNTPPYDGPSGKYCTPLDEAARLLDAYRAAVYAEVADRLAADAESGDKEGFTRIYRRSAAKQVREWGHGLRKAPTTTKPENDASVGRDTLRREFSDVLRHWGLLDEQIDQKAAEDAAVDALLALLPEPAARPEHACRNCEGIDPDTCLMNPDRPPEQCPRSEGDGYGLQCQKPAGHNLCTFEETPDA